MHDNGRKERYEALRAVGFTSYEANKLKDRTWEKVNEYIAYRKAYNEYMDKLIERTGQKKPGEDTERDAKDGIWR